jgi:hypothetical protein
MHLIARNNNDCREAIAILAWIARGANGTLSCFDFLINPIKNIKPITRLICRDVSAIEIGWILYRRGSWRVDRLSVDAGFDSVYDFGFLKADASQFF